MSQLLSSFVTLPRRRALLLVLCASALSACQPHTTTPSVSPTSAAGASGKHKQPIPVEWTRAKALSSQERRDFLADPRWAAPAQEYRKLLEEIDQGGDKLDDAKVTELSSQLTAVHTTLRTATGRQFVDVFYALRAEYVGTPAQAATLKKFSRRAIAIRSRDALKPADRHTPSSS